MELLTSATSNYLLNASLDVLHEQSIEWFENVSLWKDETAFLYTLISNYRKKTVPENIKTEIENTEKVLLGMTGGELDNLQRSVQKHEHFLNELLRKNTSDDENYRQEHRKTKFDVDAFDTKMRATKRTIFRLYEKIEK